MSATTANDAFDSIDEIAGVMNEQASAMTKKPFKRITAFGFIWRAAAIMLVFIGLLMAISFGMQFGMAYIAGLGLSETLTLVLHVMVQVAGITGATIVGWISGNRLGHLIVKRIVTKKFDAMADKIEKSVE